MSKKAKTMNFDKFPQLIKFPKGELVKNVTPMAYRKKWWHWWMTRELYALTNTGVYVIKEKTK